MNQIHQLASMALFARIVETLSYTEAAHQLGMSKSALSKEITLLETALGVSLLRRTTRKVEVTELGRAYYSYCARLLDEVKSANAFLQQYHEEPFGNLRVTTPVTFGNRVIMPLLAGFIKQHLHVQVDLELTDRAVDIEEEDIDVAIVIRRDPPQLTQAAAVASVALTPVAWGLYAAPAYLAQHPPVKQPDDLLRHGFLSFRGSIHPPGLSLHRKKKEIELKVRYLLRSNNSVSLMTAAILGAGIAYLPQYAAVDAVHNGSLQQLLPDWTLEQRTAYATFRAQRFLSPRVRLFIAHLGIHLSSTGQMQNPHGQSDHAENS